jgi:hypothetical protein
MTFKDTDIHTAVKKAHKNFSKTLCRFLEFKFPNYHFYNVASENFDKVC